MSTYYAVRKGRNPGIYNTWTAAKEQIHGYSGAEHRKFHFVEDAKAWLKSETRGDQARVVGISPPPRRSEVADQKPSIEIRDDSLCIPITPEAIHLLHLSESLGYKCPESIHQYLRFSQRGRG